MIKLFEMFAGYGGASFALKKAGIEHEVVGYSEIDKYAIQCYEQNHKGKNYGDCTKIDPNELPDFDLLTGGFPCQSFSVAGKGLGEQDTRGTLFHEIIRIAEVKKPKMMLLENVKGLTNKPHRDTFNKILSELDRIGYVVKWKVLNSKDYGIPQNRERVFFVCFRNDLLTSDFNWRFNFPEKEELRIFLKDILEENVDEKYFLTKEQVERLLKYERSFNERVCNKDVANTLCARDYNDPKLVFYQCDPKQKGNNSQMDRIYFIKGVANTLCARDLRSKDIKILLNKAIMVGNLSRYIMKNPRNIYAKEDGISWCVSTKSDVGISTDGYTIRKLTPKECFRLMGFLDDGINLEGLSDTQRYKLAGNGWDINLVSKIFKKFCLRKNLKKGEQNVRRI